MIRDLMVWLDGGVSDEIRLAAVADIARRLERQVVIGLFLNVLPLPAVVDADVAGSAAAAHLHSLLAAWPFSAAEVVNAGAAISVSYLIGTFRRRGA